jgi:proton-dependent oligopeptide transporter, POT family
MSTTEPNAFVKQLGFFSSIGSLGYVFWICGGMEMIERLAFYGVMGVRTIYGTASVESGGLGVSPTRFGDILSVWALVQSIVPALTGGLSDRYGYKRTIFLSTVINIAGYLVMAFFPTFAGFFAGAMLLATGTAIFKPGLQGTVATATKRENSSMAWGIFYQTVNIGGFIGPLMAASMRKLAWRNVFLACAAIICVNFLFLLTYKEPARAARSERKREDLLRASLKEITKPHVWTYLLIFSFFWFMFMSLFDVLPNHIQDWVDTRPIVAAIFQGAEPGWLTNKLIALSRDRTEILPEGMVNIDAGMIMVTCFFFAYLSGKLRATTSMVLGSVLAVLGLVSFGFSVTGWLTALGILIFSVGEMLSAPKFSEFMSNLAPPEKKAMYLGFSQVPLAIGWSLEGKLGPTLYDRLGSKESFAREMLAERGWAADKISAIPQGKAFDTLVELLQQGRWEVTQQLYQLHHESVAKLWYIMGTIGLISAIGIFLYGRWIARMTAAR